MRKLLIALVAALLVIALLAAPVMAQRPTEIPVPEQASQGAEQANEHSADEAPKLVLPEPI
ncbi:unnamed protein product [marine sediment metagenome]|uniref:Uncharacterized protein n=1 Tax=marine sediment metagenome TaxID=412755 RepID=X1IZX6_9ZZZZ